MILKINSKSVVVVDLDDTFYKEIDYLKSAFKEISFLIDGDNSAALFEEMIKLYDNRKDVFGDILRRFNSTNIKKEDLIKIYRSHKPDITLVDGAYDFLLELQSYSVPLGLLTDGRSLTQRNKIEALELEQFFNEIVISDEFGSKKPDKRNFLYFQDKYKNHADFYYIGDNFEKDFITPNALGWVTIGLLDNGQNVHQQNENLSKDYLPLYRVKSFSDIKIEYEE